MTVTVGRYTFTSWLRKGIAASIRQLDNLASGVATVKERASVPVQIQVNGAPIAKDVPLLGPGDVIGMNPQMVVRTEPPPGIGNFEPNYLVFIELYDEDFLWRYTPASASGDKLRPWLALLVLAVGETPESSEFTFDVRRLPLPVVKVKVPAALPEPAQSWAWAHVHINEGHDNATEFEKFLQSLHSDDNPNHDKITCRLMSPRRLDANKAYRAFVVPAFETGRRAGLGRNDVGDADAQQPAWTGRPGEGEVELPVYYEWQFRTGKSEDFESLVKKLEPRLMDARVGIRDMDGTKPGFGMTNGTDLGDLPPGSPPQVIGLEGALRAPSTRSRPETVDVTRPFFADLASLVNLPEQLRQSGGTTPVVCPPIYGEHHALDHEIDPAGSGWLNQLNRDPRLRSAAGVGTVVVQKHQETYVARAWSQVQRILEANRRIQLTRYAMVVATRMHESFTAKLGPQALITHFAPLLKKVKGSPTTLAYQLGESNLSATAVNGAFRRVIRPRGAYFRRLYRADSSFSHVALVDDLNKGRLSAAPAKPIPADLLTVEDVAEKLKDSKLEPETIAHPGKAAEGVAAAPPRDDFAFVESDPVTPAVSQGRTSVRSVERATSSSSEALRFTETTTFTPSDKGKDSVEGENFRRAAISLGQRTAIEISGAARLPLDVDGAARTLISAIDPRVAFPKQLVGKVKFPFDPGWLLQPERLVPAMAYPDFEDPMYEKLRDLSSELFLPNLKLIPEDTLSVLETNPSFIEAYFTGLNHAFGQELLWREYPTDRRGSYFRQFWDTKGIIAEASSLRPEEVAERSKDILPLDRWTASSSLGEHANPGRPARPLALVIRGELFKKYPNTIVYAQRAHVARDAQNQPQPDRPPVLVDVQSDADMTQEIRFPIFRAEIPPDLRFFGFDLTVASARGAADPRQPGDDWGWFFVIQQLPGDPRFGMDLSFNRPDTSKPISWDDLAWDRFPADMTMVQPLVPPSNFVPAAPGESLGQWGKSAAEMANILYQKPVMIAVHAKEMLEKAVTP